MLQVSFRTFLTDEGKFTFISCENGIIAKLNVLGIEIVLDLKRSPTSIVPFAVRLPHIIPQNKLKELDDQWRAFRISAKELAVSAKCVPEYWHNLGLVKDGPDQWFSKWAISPLWGRK